MEKVQDVTGNEENVLSLHVEQEHDDNLEYDDLDLISGLQENKIDIKERLIGIQKDIDITAALESLSTDVLKKPYLTKDEVDKYNKLVENHNTTSIVGINYKQVSLESFSTLINTGSIIANTASNISEKAAVTALLVKDGVIASSKFAVYLYKKVQENIIKIAASWDLVCSLIEKRWLGLTQLIKVYEMQHQNLVDRFESNQLSDSALAFFKVKLYVAKLRNDGRDIKKKDTLINAVNDDSNAVFELANSFASSMVKVKKVDVYSSKALTLSFPYKEALAMNCNTINELVRELSKNDMFSSGGVIKEYQAQSRVLVGGKIVYLNYNESNIAVENTRKETRDYIRNINFSAIKHRDGSTNDTETVEFSGLTVKEAKSIFESVNKTNEALSLYYQSNIPRMLKERESVSNLVKFATGLTGSNAAFDTIKRFFNNDDNLKAFNLVAPAAVAKLLGTFLGASSFAVFGGIVAAASATFLIDYLRKYIIANVFSMMDLQYKVTDVIQNFDHDFVDTLIEIHNQGYRVCKKLASSRNWEY